MTRKAKIQRRPRHINVPFPDWIRRQDCLVCSTRTPPLEQKEPSDAAHVPTRLGPRAGLVPLCPYHHRRAGGGGGPESHHELGQEFWRVHFDENSEEYFFAYTAQDWANFYLALFEKERS
jgi:hypothetical protein